MWLALPALLGCLSAASADPTSPAELPCIPDWVRWGTQPVIAQTESTPLATGGRTQYNPLVQFMMTSDVFDAYFDPSAGVTEIYVGNYPDYRVDRYTVLPDHTVFTTPLPVPYGQAWLHRVRSAAPCG
jgi:hypothetical protein